MIISNFILIALFISGIMCFVLVHYIDRIKGLKALFLLITGLVLLISFLFFDEVIVINDESNFTRNKYFSKMGDFNFTFKNGEVLNKSVENNLIVNNTSDQLVVEQVEYGSIGNSNSEENSKIIIPPFSSINMEKPINYLFREPPQTIRVKSGESKVKYWLHKELIQSQE